MRCTPRDLSSGDKVHIYSNSSRIVIQLRRQIATEEDVTGASFKVGVELTPLEAVAIATELFTVASPRITSQSGENAPTDV
jgi:hypothetical protein